MRTPVQWTVSLACGFHHIHSSNVHPVTNRLSLVSEMAYPPHLILQFLQDLRTSIRVWGGTCIVIFQPYITQRVMIQCWNWSADCEEVHPEIANPASILVTERGLRRPNTTRLLLTLFVPSFVKVFLCRGRPLTDSSPCVSSSASQHS